MVPWSLRSRQRDGAELLREGAARSSDRRCPHPPAAGRSGQRGAAASLLPPGRLCGTGQGGPGLSPAGVRRVHLGPVVPVPRG